MEKRSFKPLVLSADDDDDAHLLLRRAFAKAGSDSTLTQVNDGTEVIAYLSGHSIDREKFPTPRVLLLDLKMPRSSGFDVLEYFSQQPHLRTFPIIVFSSSDVPQDVARAYELGCDAYMVKPTDFEKLVELVRQIETKFLSENKQPSEEQGSFSSFLRPRTRPNVSEAEANPKPMKPQDPESPEIFRLLVEQVKDYAIFMLSKEGIILSWNEGARRSKGYEPHEIIGKHFSIFYPKSEIDANKPQFELRMAQEMGRYEEEGWRLRKDGSRFWANVVITPLRNSKGELQGYAKVTRDLTQRKFQEESFQRLLESEERFRLLVEQVKDYAIFMLDAKGVITSWNQGARRLKGYTSDEIIGKHFSIFYTPEAKAKDHPTYELNVALREGRYEEEGWRVKKDGTLFWANVVITAVWDKRGSLNGFAKVTRDLTERKKEEDAVRKKNQELEAFAHTVSHDLRAPLRSISNFAQLLTADGGDGLSQADRQLFLQKIIKASQSMETLINDILQLSQLSIVPASVQAVSLEAIIDESITALDAEVRGKKAEIVIKKPLPLVRGHRTILLQIFTNLLANALKFTRKGQMPRIKVYAVEKEHRCEIHVKDYGVGIPERHLETIFNVFDRGDARADSPGTGVGLAIVKRAVERLDGTVTVKSTPGEGSDFVVTLHCGTASPVPAGEHPTPTL